MGTSVAIKAKSPVSHDTAVQVLRMAEKFYANPENKEKFAAWHLKKYGCLPENTKGAGDNA